MAKLPGISSNESDIVLIHPQNPEHVQAIQPALIQLRQIIILQLSGRGQNTHHPFTLIHVKTFKWSGETLKALTHSSSMFSKPKRAPSISFVMPLRCIFSDLRAFSSLKIRLSTTRILLRLNSLKSDKNMKRGTLQWENLNHCPNNQRERQDNEGN